MAGLQFSNTSSRELGIIQGCEDALNFPAAAISGNTNLLAQFTRNINIWYHKVITMVLQSEDGWDFDDATITSTYPVATRAMVGSQRDYKFSTALWSLIGVEGGSAGANAAIVPLRIKRVDFTYDGSTYYKAELVDTGQIGQGLGNDTNTDGYFSQNKPYYDLANGSLMVYPTATAVQVTGGAKIRIEFTRAATEFVVGDTTKQPGFDLTFHGFLIDGPSYDYAMVKNLPHVGGLAEKVKEWEIRLKQYFGLKDTDTQFILAPANTLYT